MQIPIFHDDDPQPQMVQHCYPQNGAISCYVTTAPAAPHVATPQDRLEQVANAYWIYGAVLLIWMALCMSLRCTGKINMTRFWYSEDESGVHQVNSEDTTDF